MPLVDTRYFKSPTESIEQYKTRTSSYQTPISSSSMSGGQSTTPVTIPTPTITTPTPLPELQLTEPEKQSEQQQQDVLSSTMDIQNELAGQGTFTEQQESQQDIIGKKQAVASFQNQMKQLQFEARGTQLQLQQTLQQQQEAARGQGITAGGLAPHQRAAQTTANQQLLSNAIKQYSVGAQLYAAQGDLATALNYVEQAVNLKYQPLRDRLAAQKANLEIIKSSPNFTSAQKKRAAILEEELRQRTESLKQQRENDMRLEDAKLKAITDNANNPSFDSITRAAIQAAQSPFEVQAILQSQGIFPVQKQPTQLTKLDNGETVLVNTQTGEIIKRLGGVKAVVPEVAPGISAEGTPTTGNAQIDAWVNGLRNGTYKPSDIPKELKNAVAQGINQITPEMKNGELDKAQKLKESLKVLKDSPALGNAVGPISQRLPTLRGATADFEAYFNNVKSLLTLENLGLMKGVLSDSDIKILKEAATPLTLNMSEGGFTAELDKMIKTIDEAVIRARKAPSTIPQDNLSDEEAWTEYQKQQSQK